MSIFSSLTGFISGDDKKKKKSYNNPPKPRYAKLVYPEKTKQWYKDKDAGKIVKGVYDVNSGIQYYDVGDGIDWVKRIQSDYEVSNNARYRAWLKKNHYTEDGKKESRGFLDRVLGVLGYSGVVEGLYNITDDNPNTTFRQGLKQGLRELNPLEDDVSKRKTFSDVLQNLGWEDKDKKHISTSDVGRGIVGFLGDVALDPLSYINLFSSAGKIIKGSGKVVKGLDLTKDAIKAEKINSVGRRISAIKSGGITKDNVRHIRYADVEQTKKTFRPLQERFGWSEDELTRIATEKTNKFNKKVMKLYDDPSDMGRGLTVGFGKGVELVSADKLRNIGDKTIAPYYNRLAKEIRTSRLGKMFSKNNQAEYDAISDFDGVFSKFLLDEKNKGAKGFSFTHNATVASKFNEVMKTANEAVKNGDDTAVEKAVKEINTSLGKDVLNKALRAIDDGTIRNLVQSAQIKSTIANGTKELSSEVEKWHEFLANFNEFVENIYTRKNKAAKSIADVVENKGGKKAVEWFSRFKEEAHAHGKQEGVRPASYAGNYESMEVFDEIKNKKYRVVDDIERDLARQNWEKTHNVFSKDEITDYITGKTYGKKVDDIDKNVLNMFPEEHKSYIDTLENKTRSISDLENSLAKLDADIKTVEPYSIFKNINKSDDVRQLYNDTNELEKIYAHAKNGGIIKNSKLLPENVRHYHTEYNNTVNIINSIKNDENYKKFLQYERTKDRKLLGELKRDLNVKTKAELDEIFTKRLSVAESKKEMFFNKYTQSLEDNIVENRKKLSAKIEPNWNPVKPTHNGKNKITSDRFDELTKDSNATDVHESLIYERDSLIRDLDAMKSERENFINNYDFSSNALDSVERKLVEGGDEALGEISNAIRNNHTPEELFDIFNYETAGLGGDINELRDLVDDVVDAKDVGVVDKIDSVASLDRKVKRGLAFEDTKALRDTINKKIFGEKTKLSPVYHEDGKISSEVTNFLTEDNFDGVRALEFVTAVKNGEYFKAIQTLQDIDASAYFNVKYFERAGSNAFNTFTSHLEKLQRADALHPAVKPYEVKTISPNIFNESRNLDPGVCINKALKKDKQTIEKHIIDRLTGEFKLTDEQIFSFKYSSWKDIGDVLLAKANSVVPDVYFAKHLNYEEFSKMYDEIIAPIYSTMFHKSVDDLMHMPYQDFVYLDAIVTNEKSRLSALNRGKSTFQRISTSAEDLGRKTYEYVPDYKVDFAHDGVNGSEEILREKFKSADNTKQSPTESATFLDYDTEIKISNAEKLNKQNQYIKNIIGDSKRFDEYVEHFENNNYETFHEKLQHVVREETNVTDEEVLFRTSKNYNELNDNELREILKCKELKESNVFVSNSAFLPEEYMGRELDDALYEYAVKDGYMLTTESGAAKYYNSIEKSTGYSPDKVLGVHVNEQAMLNVSEQVDKNKAEIINLLEKYNDTFPDMTINLSDLNQVKNLQTQFEKTIEELGKTFDPYFFSTNKDVQELLQQTQILKQITELVDDTNVLLNDGGILYKLQNGSDGVKLLKNENFNPLKQKMLLKLHSIDKVKGIYLINRLSFSDYNKLIKNFADANKGVLHMKLGKYKTPEELFNYVKSNFNPESDKAMIDYITKQYYPRKVFMEAFNGKSLWEADLEQLESFKGTVKNALSDLADVQSSLNKLEGLSPNSLKYVHALTEISERFDANPVLYEVFDNLSVKRYLDDCNVDVSEMIKLHSKSNEERFVNEIAYAISKFNNKLGMDEVLRGKLKKEQLDYMKWRYVQHRLTPEAKAWLESATDEERMAMGYPRVKSGEIGNEKNFAKHRKKGTIEERNAEMKKITGIDEFFETDAAEVFVGRAVESGDLIVSTDSRDFVLQGLCKEFGEEGVQSIADNQKLVVYFHDLLGALNKKAEVINFHHAKKNGLNRKIEGRIFDVEVEKKRFLDEFGLNEKVNLNNPFIEVDKETFERMQKRLSFLSKNEKTGESYVRNKVKGYVMYDKVFDTLTNAVQIQNKDAEKGFWKVFDKLLNFYKSINTLTPGFHVQNAFGNMCNSFFYCGFASMNPKLLKAAKTIATNPDPKQFIKFDVGYLQGKTLTYKQLNQMLTDLGVLDTSFWNKEIGSGDFALFKFSRNIGSSIENTQRTAMFIEALKNGETPERAREIVDKFLFDYSDLTDVEKVWFRRAIPFYTYMRKNVPLQLEMMMENPHIFRNLEYAQSEFEKINGDNYIPDRFRNEWKQDYIQLPFAVNGRPVGISMQYPFEQLDRLKLNKLVGQSNPVIKTPIEMATGKYAYTQIPIENGGNYLQSFASPLNTIGITERKDASPLEKILYGGSRIGLGLPADVIKDSRE